MDYHQDNAVIVLLTEYIKEDELQRKQSKNVDPKLALLVAYLSICSVIHFVIYLQVYLTFAAPKSHRDDEMGYHPSMSQMGQRSGMSPYSFSTPNKPPSTRFSGRSSTAYSWHSGEHSSSPRT